MTRQTFDAGAEPRIVVTDVNGDIRIRVWDAGTVLVETDASPRELVCAEMILTIGGCDDDLDLRVPGGSTISVTRLDGDIAVEGVRRIELAQVRGDVDLEHIAEAVEATDLAGDLDVVHTPIVLVRGIVGGEVDLADVTRIEIEAVADDMSIQRATTVVAGSVDGNLDVDHLTGDLRCGTVGRDCEIQDSPQAEITLNMISGDLEIENVGRIHVGGTGGDCDMYAVPDGVQVVHIGGDAGFTQIGSHLQVGDIGGDAALKDIQGTIEIGTINDNLELHTAFSPDSPVRLNVGGDSTVILPDKPDVQIQASVIGQIRGNNVGVRRDGRLVRLVYGEGAARLELTVGGDLELRASTNPRSSAGDIWGEFEQDLGAFGREMGKIGQEVGREMGKLGQELGHDFSSLFGWSSETSQADQRSDAEATEKTQRKGDQRARRMRQRAEARARQARERAEAYAHQQRQERVGRMRVRFHDREWWFDPQRLERIKEQAQYAASEGLSDAIDAVEQAISKLYSVSPARPEAAPASEPAEQTGASEASTAPAATGPTTRLQPDEPAADASDRPAADVAQQREAILHMVAEGRITPEEGDLLLEALEH